MCLICFFLPIYYMLLVSRFLFYISRLRSALYVPHLAFFSFYLALVPPLGLSVSTLPFYLKSIWLLLFHLSFFLLFPFSFLPCLFYPLLSDSSQSLPLFLPPSHILYLPTAKPAREVQSLTRRETSNNHVSLSSI